MSRNDDLLSLIHTGDDYDRYLNAVVPPVFLNSLHAYDSVEEYYSIGETDDDAFVYCRDGNPTVRILERKVAELEHGACALAFGSGMAAFSAAVMATCKTGSHVICMRDTYMCVKRMFDSIFTPKFQMSVTFVTGNDLQEIEDAVQDNTDLMIIESPATFVFRVVDLKAIAEIAHRRGFKTYIDNSCLTPIYQKPLDYGIDFVMHTMSKFMGGHSDIVGGILVSNDAALMKTIKGDIRAFFGGVLGPMEAWLVIRGLRTLEVRLERYQKTGSQVASFLENHEKVKRVYHTSLKSHPQADIIARQQTGHTNLMSFELKSDKVEDAIAVANRLKVFKHGCSWGGHESLVILPLLKEPQRALDVIGGNPGLIRIYCGLEGAELLIQDLEQALDF